LYDILNVLGFLKPSPSGAWNPSLISWNLHTLLKERQTQFRIFLVRWGEVRWYWWSWLFQPATTSKCPKVGAFAYCVVGDDLIWGKNVYIVVAFVGVGSNCCGKEKEKEKAKAKRGFLVISALESWQSDWRRKLLAFRVGRRKCRCYWSR
jgi:hypothetical protein